jgi:hypothetical protein
MNLPLNLELAARNSLAMSTNLPLHIELAVRLDPSVLMEMVGFAPDDWQRRALRSTHNRVLMLCSRQVGKSTVAGMVALNEAMFREQALVLMVARVERQSVELLRKTISAYNALGRPVEAVRELQGCLELSNGSRVLALPGEHPAAIRCYSGPSMIIVDEACQCIDALFPAILPMLGSSNGRLLCLSTPFGKRGWFYEQWISSDPTFERIKARATECPRISPGFLAEERRMLGPTMYSQEHEAEFIEAEGQVFSSESISQCFEDTSDVPILSGF